MNRAEIVRRFGRLADCPPPRSGLLSLEIRGKRWVIAHSGHACIAVRSTAKFREPKPAGTNKRLIAKWLTSRVRGYEVNIKALSDFCGRLPDELRGSYPMWKRNIDGVQFNGFLVRRYLSAALAPTAVLQTALPTDPMILAGKDWRIVVMPVHVEKPEGPIWRPNA